jgi:hypothetical protein
LEAFGLCNFGTSGLRRGRRRLARWSRFSGRFGNGRGLARQPFRFRAGARAQFGRGARLGRDGWLNRLDRTEDIPVYGCGRARVGRQTIGSRQLDRARIGNRWRQDSALWVNRAISLGTSRFWRRFRLETVGCGDGSRARKAGTRIARRKVIGSPRLAFRFGNCRSQRQRCADQAQQHSVRRTQEARHFALLDQTKQNQTKQ